MKDDGAVNRRARADHPSTSKAGAFHEGRLDGQEEERAAIVAWLRREARTSSNAEHGPHAMERVANAIEKGHHRG